jgi:RNA polymerase sigma-70 factor (ECF subfamily)
MAGSEQASRDLVRRYERPVFNLIVRMVRDPALAEDLAQETFVKVFAHLDTYDCRYKFASWILKIAHNTTIDYLRRPRPTAVSLDDCDERDHGHHDAGAPSPLALVERKELADVLDDAIDRLRPEYRQVVVLRYHEELSYEEIAEVLDLPLGTVKSYLHRARGELAQTIARAGWASCNTAPEPSVGRQGRV